jgi:hypothetical protein
LPIDGDGGGRRADRSDQRRAMERQGPAQAFPGCLGDGFAQGPLKELAHRIGHDFYLLNSCVLIIFAPHESDAISWRR